MNTQINEVRSDIGEEAPAFRLEKMSIAYSGNVAVSGVTLNIPQKQLMALIGPSGCGKSTILRSLCRLNDLIPGVEVSGRISLFHEDIRQMDAIAVHRRVGMVFQRPNPFPKSIYENIALGLRVNGYRGRIDEMVERSLQQVALWDEVKDRLRSSALNLSGGQQQRLCIARALSLQPEVILMDEPCSALDPIASLRIDNLLNQLKQYYTLVVVTHNLQQAARISDSVAFFNTNNDNGRIYGTLAEYGPVVQVFSEPQKKETYDYVNARSN
ncbi:MAG: phosphate ABC transporter ATP-binding protein [Oscillatoriales cyanobacterium SM2_2_1]|nr:phosphate ABC transporter ATP-binding protein [Oscillatoriales cyanobacterium SM2_2_1]